MAKAKILANCIKCGKELTKNNTPSTSIRHGIDVCKNCHAEKRGVEMRRAKRAKQKQYQEKWELKKRELEEKREAILLALEEYDELEVPDEKILAPYLSPAMRERRNELLFLRELRQIDEDFDL